MDGRAKRYREIAEEVRSTADSMADEGNRQMLMSVVADYERLARAAENIARNRTARNPKPAS